MLNISKTIIDFLKGIIVSIVFLLVSVLIFALLLQLISTNLSVIKPINLGIKTLAVVIAVIVGARGEKLLIKGLILGVLVNLISFLVFSIIAGEFNFSSSLIWESLLYFVIGGLTAFIKAVITK